MHSGLASRIIHIFCHHRDMNSAGTVYFIGEVSQLKNTLKLLGRCKQGALNATSKTNVEILLERFLMRVANVVTDASVANMIATLQGFAHRLAVMSSNARGPGLTGYQEIEMCFGEIQTEIGKLDGYMYCLASMYNLRRSGVDLNLMFA